MTSLHMRRGTTWHDSIGPSLDLLGARRATAPPRSARHPLHADARCAPFAAAAAALQCELDVPEWRRASCSPASADAPRACPRGKRCDLAASGTTLVLDLAIHAIEKIVTKSHHSRRRLPGRRRGAGEHARATHTARHARRHRRYGRTAPIERTASIMIGPALYAETSATAP